MCDQSAPAGDQSETPKGAGQPERVQPLNTAPAKPSASQNFQKVEKELSVFEQSTLRWARTAVIMSALAAIFVSAQWYEMHTGGRDTHNLAASAGNQATWTEHLAGAADVQSGHMRDQVDRTKELADQMKSQADRTKDLVWQATIQANEAGLAANSARKAADVAEQALHISQRAYLVTGIPTDDLPGRNVRVPIYNAGHIPSGQVRIIIHEVTAIERNPSATTPVGDIIERHWSQASFESVPAFSVGSLYAITVKLPSVVPDALTTGGQRIVIVAVLTYHDGFPNTPEQTWVFCEASTYASKTREFTMRPCADPHALLGLLTRLDEYPNTKYQTDN